MFGVLTTYICCSFIFGSVDDFDHIFFLFRYIDVFLRIVTSEDGYIFSPARQAFLSRKRSAIKAENYTDPTGRIWSNYV